MDLDQVKDRLPAEIATSIASETIATYSAAFGPKYK